MLLDSEVPEAKEALERGSRVLVLALSQEKLDHHKPQKPSDIQALALLEILDPIREGAAETLDYLRSQEVGLKNYLWGQSSHCIQHCPEGWLCGLSQLCRLLKNHG